MVLVGWLVSIYLARDGTGWDGIGPVGAGGGAVLLGCTWLLGGVSFGAELPCFLPSSFLTGVVFAFLTDTCRRVGLAVLEWAGSDRGAAAMC